MTPSANFSMSPAHVPGTIFWLPGSFAANRIGVQALPIRIMGRMENVRGRAQLPHSCCLIAIDASIPFASISANQYYRDGRLVARGVLVLARRSAFLISMLGVRSSVFQTDSFSVS